ncbi:uncharacterized protein BX663DRAFT_488845 [Cokeromyces recurvatus]|uniref:uncharacterized protein n=1 Tax=Cokeromyces recurvatus TaxID=90255 RepID=UPI00221F5D6F|nr:uncharacterized protein BX663DRAFT_488845 [Cokeromyces recurvatus]KAI7899849.1 hypothetical protein BX663DRAFT_488845 [Cokeromyces recurvatus]
MTTSISDSYFSLTPCTRLSRMALDSESDNDMHFEFRATNFNERLMKAAQEESENNQIYDDSTGIQINFPFSEDEGSDEEGSFSFDSYKMMDQKSLSRESEMYLTPLPNNKEMIMKSIFDEEEDEHYDPTIKWLLSVYEGDDDMEEEIRIVYYDDDKSNIENKPPPNYEQKARQLNYNRTPFKVIYSKDDDHHSSLSDQEELPIKKKVILSSKNESYKTKAILRSLSPPRFLTKHKGKEPMRDLLC